MTLATEASSDNFVQLDVLPWEWIALTVVVVGLLLADLLIVHRTAHEISFREALIESGVWIAIALTFGLVVLWGWGAAAAGEYYAGYLIEKSLSIDNVFVWAVILGYFKVPPKYQFRVLFWGVFGALVLRAVFIFAGVALLERFEWLLFVFGAFLLYTAWKLAQPDDHEVDPEHSLVLRAVRRVVPTTNELHGQKMFIRENGHLMATPLFAVLVLIEATDVVFAVDSVPAILAVSREPFLVLSSNAFAILGLRALYFAFAGMKDRFRYLDYGLAGVLAFVGLKMIIAEWYHVPTWASLVVIATFLTISIWWSLRNPPEAGADDVDPDTLPAEGAGVSEMGGWDDVEPEGDA
ncbi:TerC family protein [Nitriliruptoria bacterium AS10]|nr:TerC family protein [Salsipaludibacter albus]